MSHVRSYLEELISVVLHKFGFSLVHAIVGRGTASTTHVNLTTMPCCASGWPTCVAISGASVLTSRTEFCPFERDEYA